MKVYDPRRQKAAEFQPPFYFYHSTSVIIGRTIGVRFICL